MSSLMWRERMDSDMVVAGLAKRTREASLQALRMLSQGAPAGSTIAAHKKARTSRRAA